MNTERVLVDVDDFRRAQNGCENQPIRFSFDVVEKKIIARTGSGQAQENFQTKRKGRLRFAPRDSLLIE
jgi:hypothetical protein